MNCTGLPHPPVRKFRPSTWRFTAAYISAHDGPLGDASLRTELDIFFSTCCFLLFHSAHDQHDFRSFQSLADTNQTIDTSAYQVQYILYLQNKCLWCRSRVRRSFLALSLPPISCGQQSSMMVLSSWGWNRLTSTQSCQSTSA